jgi:hypothetical protein
MPNTTCKIRCRSVSDPKELTNLQEIGTKITKYALVFAMHADKNHKLRRSDYTKSPIKFTKPLHTTIGEGTLFVVFSMLFFDFVGSSLIGG